MEARENYIKERALQLLGTAKLAAAIQDDMTGYHGHEPNSIAMLLSGAARAMDYKEVDARVMQIAREVAEQGMGADMSLTMAERKRPPRRSALPRQRQARIVGQDQPGIVGNVVRSLVRGDRVSRDMGIVG